jgi:hypothetical protein
MSNIPAELRYAASHEWIKVEGSTGTVGISDHAQSELSDVVYVELPKVGTKVTAGSVVATIESVKAAGQRRDHRGKHRAHEESRAGEQGPLRRRVALQDCSLRAG